MDQLFGLVYFHPLYDRDQVAPPDGPAYGHIPPLAWLPAMAKAKVLKLRPKHRTAIPKNRSTCHLFF